MTFGKAFDYIRQNEDHYMRLPFWSPDVKIKVKYPKAGSFMTAPYLYAESRVGRVPWKETMVELFSDAWGVGQEESKAVLREEIK